MKAHVASEGLAGLCLNRSEQIRMKTLAMEKHVAGDYQEHDQVNDSASDPQKDFFPPVARASTLFWYGSEERAIGKRGLRKRAQNACPKVMKYCVDWIPGGALRLWPTSTRTGPSGVL
jgi:hypothetical protein